MPSNVCVTLDLEEDHAGLTQQEPRYEALHLLPIVVDRLKTLRIPLSIFVAGNFIERQGQALETLRDLEFHSHAYHHPPLKTAGEDKVRQENMEKGLNTFQSFFKKIPVGYRAPYGIYQPRDLAYLHERGVQFDSSLFPCIHLSGFRPWLSSKPTYDPRLGVVEFPISSLFGLRIPYSFSYMNLLGIWPYQLFSSMARLPNPLIINFHLHDFLHTSSADQLSPFFKLIYGHKTFEPSWARFELLLRYFQTQGVRFISMNQAYQGFRNS